MLYIYLSTAPAVAMETSSLRLRTDVMLIEAAWEKRKAEIWMKSYKESDKNNHYQKQTFPRLKRFARGIRWAPLTTAVGLHELIYKL